MIDWAETIDRANPRPASPLDAGRNLERASCSPPFLSAAVAHRWPRRILRFRELLLAGPWIAALAILVSSAMAAPVRMSFLVDVDSRRDTMELLQRHGFRDDGIRRFAQAIDAYNVSPLTVDLSRFPSNSAGFYEFRTIDEIVDLLARPLCETAHAWEFNCFDSVITLAMPQLESRVGIDELMGPILVPHTTTNGMPLTLPVATAADAFHQAYAEWYRESTAEKFPGLLGVNRVALTAALYRVHVLRMATEEAKLETEALQVLRRNWREHRLHFPSNAQIVLVHLVYYPGRWLWTAHVGVLTKGGPGYTYIEKAGGCGPFVRLDLRDRGNLIPWFRKTFRDSGYTHMVVTFNDFEARGEELAR